VYFCIQPFPSIGIAEHYLKVSKKLYFPTLLLELIFN